MAKAAWGAVLFALCMVCIAFAQPAQAAQPLTVDGSGQVTTQAMENGRIYESDAGYIEIRGITSGSVAYDPATKTITLDNASGSDAMVWVQLAEQAINLNLVGESKLGFDTYKEGKTLTVSGDGRLIGRILSRCGRNVITQSGTIEGILDTSDTDENGEEVWGDVTLKGGTVSGTVECGMLCIDGGAIVASNCKDFAIRADGLDMNGGKIELGKCVSGIRVTKSLSMSDGAIRMTNITDGDGEGYGISAGSITQTGGSVELLKCDVPLSADGKVTIKGGTLSATARAPKANHAIDAKSMTCKEGCLKAIEGGLPKGMCFSAGGNSYQVLNRIGDVALLKYGAKSKKPVLGSTTYGKYTYAVTKIASKAFDTKSGRKVTAITLRNGSYTKSRAKLKDWTIAKYAFYNTKSLRKLTIKNKIWREVVDYSGRNPAFKSVKASSTIKKNAFAKCGRNGGKGLTIVVDLAERVTMSSRDWFVPEGWASRFKSVLVSKGMSKYAKIKPINVYYE